MPMFFAAPCSDLNQLSFSSSLPAADNNKDYDSIAGMFHQAVANCRFQKAKDSTENNKENG
jgi:hypothetical protein